MLRRRIFLTLLVFTSLYLVACQLVQLAFAPTPLPTVTQTLTAIPTATLTPFSPVFPTEISAVSSPVLPTVTSTILPPASPTVTFTPEPTPTVILVLPAAPAGLTATAVSAFQIDLAWMDISNDETSFEVERCMGSACSSFDLLSSLPGGAQAYSDNMAQPQTDYCYRVYASSPFGFSAYSNIACASTPPEAILEVAPALPQLIFPENAASGMPLSLPLSVLVVDNNQEVMDVTFYGRPYEPEGQDFTLIVLPDTQYYSRNYPDIFRAQIQWIVANQASQNILFVTHLGDIVDSGDWTGADTEWINASNAITLLETNGANIPYGLAVGNHDQAVSGDPDSTTAHYNAYFGVTHFSGRPYYGGHFGSDNDNHYELFNSGGLKFIIIHIESAADPNNATFRNVVAWSEGLLATPYKSWRGIVVFHNLFSLSDKTQFSTAGQYLFEQLKDNPNLFLMLGGHVGGVSQRMDAGTNGNTIYSLLANFQTESNGGDGWLRSLRFSTGDNKIYVTTYSPTLNQFKPQSDTDNTFSLDYTMTRSSFQIISSVTGAASGSAASVTWNDLHPDTQYEWYCVASDGRQLTASPIWSFTTGPSTAVSPANFFFWLSTILQ